MSAPTDDRVPDVGKDEGVSCFDRLVHFKSLQGALLAHTLDLIGAARLMSSKLGGSQAFVWPRHIPCQICRAGSSSSLAVLHRGMSRQLWQRAAGQQLP
jgi:hypothetical protein